MVSARGRVVPRPVAVLFDMDDTLFDHTSTCESALRQLWDENAVLQRRAFPEILHRYAELLEEVYPDVLAGRATHEEARDERFSRLFGFIGESITPGEAHAYSLGYRSRYQISRTPVPGAPELLRSLRGRVKVGIVSNNHQEEQLDKLRAIGLDDLVDFVVTSELAGVAKPDPAIFGHALRAAGCLPAEAVMVGDNWVADIEGARSAGIAPLWFNRFGLTSPGRFTVPELRSFTPVQSSLDVLIGPQR